MALMAGRAREKKQANQAETDVSTGFPEITVPIDERPGNCRGVLVLGVSNGGGVLADHYSHDQNATLPAPTVRGASEPDTCIT